MRELGELTKGFAEALKSVDARRPVASNARTGKPFLPGIGPNTERTTVKLVAEEMKERRVHLRDEIRLEIPYPNSPRSKYDFCIGSTPDWEWAIEIKMLRLMGDNGKPNDNILMHILSPYPEHRSALTDCTKLLRAGFSGRLAIMIYGYEYPGWPMELAIGSFEILASQYVTLGSRIHTEYGGLIHPVHKSGGVFAWELFSK